MSRVVCKIVPDEHADSHVAMLQAAIAICWADCEMNANERATLHTMIDRNVVVSDDAKTMLRKDIETNDHTLEELWPRITDAYDRAHLINIVAMLGWKDGTFSDAERDAYNHINQLHHETLDVDAMRSEIATLAQLSRKQLEMEDEQYLDSLSGLGRMVEYIKRAFDADE